MLANLRPADKDEADALMGEGSAPEALRRSVDESICKWAGVAGDEVVFVFGLAPVAGDATRGAPWLVGTTLTDLHRSAFIRVLPAYIAAMLEICPVLVNVVDARNVKSIAWLKRMGFTLLPAQPIGVAGLPFHPFFKNRG